MDKLFTDLTLPSGLPFAVEISSAVLLLWVIYSGVLWTTGALKVDQNGQRRKLM